MSRFIKKSKKQAGAAPGLQIDPAAAKGPAPKIFVHTYSKDSFNETQVPDMDAAVPYIRDKEMAWIHVIGLGDLETLSKIGDLFHIHPLTLEDMANPGHPPKFEDFEDYFFVALRQLAYTPSKKMVSTHPFSIVACPNVLISVQEEEIPCLEPVLKRLRSGKGRIRNADSGYLAYALIDSIVDHYFQVLFQMGDEVETLEQEMLERVDPSHLERLHNLKREMIFSQKQVRPLREAVGSLISSESLLLPEETIRFYTDVYDHLIHILDTINSFRDLLSGMLDLYISVQANRTNDVMRTLTIIATIFIPLTFLAGIYGMNFKVMPELEWQWGYFGLLGLMAVVGGTMAVYFKKKGWF